MRASTKMTSLFFSNFTKYMISFNFITSFHLQTYILMTHAVKTGEPSICSNLVYLLCIIN